MCKIYHNRTKFGRRRRTGGERLKWLHLYLLKWLLQQEIIKTLPTAPQLFLSQTFPHNLSRSYFFSPSSTTSKQVILSTIHRRGRLNFPPLRKLLIMKFWSFYPLFLTFFWAVSSDLYVAPAFQMDFSLDFTQDLYSC